MILSRLGVALKSEFELILAAGGLVKKHKIIYSYTEMANGICPRKVRK